MATTTNFGWSTPDNTDLVKDGALAIRTLGSAIDTSMGDLRGGTSGQVLAKNTNTDMDFVWVTQDDANAIQNSIVDAKGDIITATANDVPARLAVGTNGHVLTADSTTATGLKWAAAAGGGKILQVVTAINTATQSMSSSTTYSDAITVNITPSSTSSRILLLANASGSSDINAAAIMFRLRRDTTSISVGDASGSREQVTGIMQMVTNANYLNQVHFSHVDSPATTSQITYRLQYKADAGVSTIYLGRTFNDSNNTFIGRTPSAQIIALEIGA